MQITGVQEKISYEITRDNNLTRKQLDDWRSRIAGKTPDDVAESPHLA